ncbi:MAG: DNA ligase D [Gemmatimonadaceae bacterium]
MIAPMKATSVQQPPPEKSGPWVYEPKYDGIRLLAVASGRDVALVTRNGIDRAHSFPEVAAAMRALTAGRRNRDFILDGELVAIRHGRPARFQELQARGQDRDPATVRFIAFDLLLCGRDSLLDAPWRERRERLEEFLRRRPAAIGLSEVLPGSAADAIAEATREGWEGVIAKRADSGYRPGARSKDWLKLKLEHEQEFVVGGWTEPRNSRPYIGALLLGYHDDEGRFVYAGHTGTGFTREGLRAMHRTLLPLERATSPFVRPPKTNETPHWVVPKVVVQIRFNEWTRDGKLRQPVFLGVRDDKPPAEVVREPEILRGAHGTHRNQDIPHMTVRKKIARKAGRPTAKRATRRGSATLDVVQQVADICADGGSGTIHLGPGLALNVSNLDKVFFPRARATKGDLMAYYAAVAPVLLPALRDRPLVLRRFPNGIRGGAFYQQKAPPNPPKGVRTEVVADEGLEPQRRLIGGDLITLLYTIQLGAISTDPWHSRVPAVQYADYSIIDLDPGPTATFQRVVDVAHWVREVLDEMTLHAVLKTSGSTGVHLVLPLCEGTPNEDARIVAQMVAQRVAKAHPKHATIARKVAARANAAVYVDYLQNIRGKTVASVYAARARPEASVSTPITWEELDQVHPTDFTIRNVPQRLRDVGDLWAKGMRKKNDLRKLLAR